MDVCKIIYTKEASTIIKHLPPPIKKGVRHAIDEMRDDPYIGKSLHEELHGLRSHRFKRYRIVYRYNAAKKLLEIVFVGPRQNVYDLLKKAAKKS